jgi:hypothetical protein
MSEIERGEAISAADAGHGRRVLTKALLASGLLGLLVALAPAATASPTNGCAQAIQGACSYIAQGPGSYVAQATKGRWYVSVNGQSVASGTSATSGQLQTRQGDRVTLQLWADGVLCGRGFCLVQPAVGFVGAKDN